MIKPICKKLLTSNFFPSYYSVKCGLSINKTFGTNFWLGSALQQSRELQDQAREILKNVQFKLMSGVEGGRG
jgi:hypothetical protein